MSGDQNGVDAVLDNLDRIELEAQRKARLSGKFFPRIVTANGRLIEDVIDGRDFSDTQGLPPRDIALEGYLFTMGLGCAHPTLVNQFAHYS